MPRPPWWLACCIKTRALAGCGGARGAAAVPAETGGVKWGHWGRAFLITSTARAAHAHRNSKPQRRTRMPAGARCPGLRWAKGPRFAAGAVISADAVLVLVPVGAGLLAMALAGVLPSAGGMDRQVPEDASFVCHTTNFVLVKFCESLLRKNLQVL